METKQRKKSKKSKKILSEESLEDFREKKAKRGVVRLLFYFRRHANRR
jgi:hypothetical protein